jgi:Flp pilus assembly pilin Flp
MKKILFFIVLPLLSMAQTQIGADINGEGSDDESGVSVSFSSDGTILAIGAPFNGGNGFTPNCGSVRVYKNVSGTWTQIGTDIDGQATGDNSGISISLSSDGTTLAIGAPLKHGNGLNSGQVRVYKFQSGTWTQIGANINGEAASDIFGRSVSLSSDGTTVAIGAILNDGSGSNAGHVRVFKNVSNTWTQIGADIDGETTGDNSGVRVSLSNDGTIVAIGAPLNDGSGTDAGHVRVYKNISNTWTQIGADIDGEAAFDNSGRYISLSSDGNTLAIGAYFNDGNGLDSGHVRVYKNISNTWTQIGADIDGEAGNDNSGWSVSLSCDGTIVAIGASNNDGGGTNAGHVRIYKNVSNTWTQIGADINGEAFNDNSGGVSLSSDGTVLAIGALFNDGNGTDSGHIRVYDLTAILASNSFVQANFSIFPNPTSDVLNIQLENNLELQKVTIYSTLGQLVKTDNKSQINVSDLAKGNYFVEVITNQGKATKTIIIK